MNVDYTYPHKLHGRSRRPSEAGARWFVLAVQAGLLALFVWLAIFAARCSDVS